MMSDFPYVIDWNGDWAFTYKPVLGESADPARPVPEEFTGCMAVPGYWDDHLEQLKRAAFWPTVKFNPDYRPIDFSEGCYEEDAHIDAMPDASLPYVTGVGWYRRVFPCPETWKGARVTLEIGAVSLEAWVWLNGTLRGHHLGHSTPFEVRLDPELLPDQQNELIIAVANTRKDRLGCVLRGYKGCSGGIYRSVRLRITGLARIAQWHVHPDADNRRLTWSLDLDGEGQDGDLIRWSVRDAGPGRTLGEGAVPVGETRVTWETDTSGMEAWSDHTPRLYEIEVALYRKDKVLDIRHRSFGLRRLTSHGTGLRLNGRPFLLRGVTESCYFPLTCTPPPDVNAYREMLRRVKALGFNWVRFHTWVPSQEYMQAADEEGLLIQVEAPVEFGESEWLDILRGCRSHPSVVIYCGGNEELLDEEKIAFLGRMAALCRQEVPDALFSPQEALRGVEYGWQDADLGEDVAVEPFRHNASRLEALKAFSDVFGQYAWGEFSYESFRGDWQRVQGRMRVYEKPCLAHEIGILGTSLDLDLEHRYVGTRIGTGLYSAARKGIETAGLSDRAEEYYRNSCAWARLLRKQIIENVRKCGSYAGYDFLGAVDQHYLSSGYSAGIMNEFYELKPGESAKTIQEYNGESVLLLDCTTARNLRAREPLDVELFASLYGANPLNKGHLAWRLLDGEGRVVLQEECCVHAIPNGAVTSLGRVRFDVPAWDCASKVTLVTQLSGDEYELTNEWDFWVFPPEACAPSSAAVRVVSVLDAETLAGLADGQRVVLLGDAPFPTLPLDFQIAKPGRLWGNVATVIHAHPVMDGFPNDGYCDWQFCGMSSDARCVVFDDPALPFDPIIEVGSTYKHVRRQACLFEYRIGKGSLLVCTLNLDCGDPGAAHLRNSLLAYAGGESFEPRAAVSVDLVAKLVAGWSAALRESTARTHQGFDPNAQLAPEQDA